jgi:transcriptional regulator with XRE-family HTH domain
MNDTFFMMIQSRTSASDAKQRLALNLRRLRIARHLSLSELARITATSKATLSGIERGGANPTVETLESLAGALHVSIAELLEEAPAGEMHIVRAAQTNPWPPEDIGQRPLQVPTAITGSLELFELALPARCVHHLDARPEGTREALLVLHGTLIAGPVERISELTNGDYASFPADSPVVYETGRSPARALILTNAPA